MNILNKINNTLLGIGFTGKWIKVPELRFPEKVYGSIRSKSLIMIDDSADILGAFAPYLMVATHCNASFIKYRTQSLTFLAKEIIKRNCDIVLMDYHLSETIKGVDIIVILREKGFNGCIVGFSAGKFSREFIVGGADYFLNKNVVDPEQSIADLALIVGVSLKVK